MLRTPNHTKRAYTETSGSGRPSSRARTLKNWMTPTLNLDGVTTGGLGASPWSLGLASSIAAIPDALGSPRIFAPTKTVESLFSLSHEGDVFEDEEVGLSYEQEMLANHAKTGDIPVSRLDFLSMMRILCNLFSPSFLLFLSL